MQMRVRTSFIALSFLIALGACERGAPAPKAAEHDHSKHNHDQPISDLAGESTKPDEPAGPSVETGSFLLAVTPTEPGYSIGHTGDVEIALEGRGDWHVNQEYPIRVDLKAGSGVALQKTELLKEDAKEFGEKKVRFLAGVQPSSAGEHELSCDVSFAMCTEENCILERRTVAMQLRVE
jgi:hypothetical protein